MANLFDDCFVATVMKVNKETRELGVFIPKLMATMYYDDAQEYKYATNNGLDVGSVETNVSDTVTKKNYIWIKPLDMDEVLPMPGSKVFVEFIDGNPRLGYWWKFNQNGDWVPIPEERYPTLFNLKMNKEKEIKNGYTVSVNLPEYLKQTSVQNDDNLTIDFFVEENYKFYKNYDIQTAISNLQKSVSYIETSYINDFTKTITDNVLFSTTPTHKAGWVSHTTTYVDNGEYDIKPITLSSAVELTNYLKNIDSDVQLYREESCENELTYSDSEEFYNNTLNTDYTKPFYTKKKKYNKTQTEINHNWLTYSRYDANGANISAATALALLNNIDYSTYPIHNYIEISTMVEEYKNNITNAENNREVVKYMEAFMNKLNTYAITVEEDTHNSFVNIKRIAVDKIKSASNLLDAGTYKTYFNTLLNGLRETYYLYKDYRDAYDSLTDSAKNALSDSINIYKIDDNIRLIFQKAYNATDPTNIDDFLTNSKNMFATSANITYKFSTDGRTYQEYVVDTNKIFDKLSTSDYTIDYEGNRVNIINSNIEMMPVSNNFDSAASAFKVLCWKDDSGDVLDNNYYLIRSITAMPVFVGMYLTLDEDNNKINFNQYNNVGAICTYKIDGVPKTLSEVQSYVQLNGATESFTIVMTYTYASTTGTLSLSVDYGSEDYANTVIELVDYLDNNIKRDDSGNVSDDAIYAHSESIVRTYNLYTIVNTSNSSVIPSETKTKMSSLYSAYNTSVVKTFSEILSQYSITDTDVAGLQLQYSQLTTDQKALLTPAQKSLLTKLGIK